VHAEPARAAIDLVEGRKDLDITPPQPDLFFGLAQRRVKQ
jgi:hypothetical protein